MKRRKFILSIAGSLAILQGCITESNSRNNKNNTSEKNNTSSEVSGHNLEIKSLNCGNELDFSPNIDFNTESSEIIIEGIANGKDTCQTVNIDTLKYDSTEDILEVILETQKIERLDTCAECITEIGYEVIVDFEDTIPQNVHIELKDIRGTNSTTASSN